MLAHPIDREVEDRLKLIVYAKDAAGNEIEAPSEIEILVTDVNDNSPIFEQTSYQGEVEENAAKGKHNMIMVYSYL